MDTDTEPTSTHILPASFSLFSLIAEEDKSALSPPTAFCEAPTVQRIHFSTPHPAPPSLPPPPTPLPPGGIDGLLLTVHTAACSCSDQGQPNIGRKQEEHRGGEERGMIVPGVL